MRFKHQTLFLLMTITMVIHGCGNFLNENKRDDQVIELSDEKFRCLQAWPGLIRDFSAGQAHENQIRPAFQCFQKALAYFRENTRGSMPEAYTGKDFRDFFGRYFLKQTHIPPELANGFLTFKQALFGGTNQFVTKSELLRAEAFLKPLEDHVVLIAPHVRILIGKASGAEVGEEEVDRAIEQLRSSAQGLLKQVELVRSDYSLTEFQTFLGQLGQFSVSQENSKSDDTFEQISKWLPTVLAAQKVFFGERAFLRGLSEWSNAVETVIELYSFGLRYRYFMKDGLFDSPARMKSTLKAGDQLLKLLENSYQMRTFGRIPFYQIDTFIDRILEMKMIDQPLSAATVKGLYRKIVIGMLDPIRRGDSRGADALEQIHLVSLRRELNVFRLNQIFFDEIGTGDVSHQVLRAGLKSFDVKAAARRLTTDPLEQEALRESWGKVLGLLNQDHPVHFDENGRFRIEVSSPSWRWSWSSRARFNVMHLLTRAFMLGYGNHRNPNRAVVLESGLIQWYADFKEFGMDVQAFDPRAVNSGARSFREANYFTPHGDGNKQVTFEEMFEYIGLLFSAGLESSNLVRIHLDRVNHQRPSCLAEQKDIFGAALTTEICFKKELRRFFGLGFSNLPGAVHYVQGLTSEEWDDFFDALMASSKSESSPSGMLDTSDLRTAVTVLHYVEVLFITYDRNADGLLSSDEVNSAAPRFVSFLSEVSGVENTEVLAEAFSDLVFTGKKPDGWSLTARTGKKFFNWAFGGQNEEMATRLNILKVFGNLRSDLESGGTPAPGGR